MASNIVILDAYEARWAMFVGWYRHHEGERRDYIQSDGTNSNNGLINHQRGAAAELAVSKFLGLAWTASVNTYKRFPDIAGDIEVRSHGGDGLRIKPKDSNNPIFISVTRLGGRRFRIDGWIYGYEAKTDKYYQAKEKHSGNPEWVVPLDKLWTPSVLKNKINEFSDPKKSKISA
jgi:hypothetical protein